MDEVFGYFVESSCAQETLEKGVKITKKNMERRKLKAVLEVLDNVSVNYPETAQYINKNMKEVYEREKLTVEEVFFSCLV